MMQIDNNWDRTNDHQDDQSTKKKLSSRVFPIIGLIKLIVPGMILILKTKVIKDPIIVSSTQLK
jgi:hypothetical protein